MDKPVAWLEASLVCSAEIAEAVAEVFSRFAPDGVVLNSITVFDQASQEEKPTGDMRVVAYLPIDAEVEPTRAHLEESIWHLGQIVPIPLPTFTLIKDQDWIALWKQHYRPIELGQNLIVLPAWVDRALAHGKTPIFISPDMAFGTGSHPSTQLCLIALEKYGCKDLNVIDIGTGSGILAIAAVRLGADLVLGVDNDAGAIPSAKRNATLNEMPDRIQFEAGTHLDVLARTDVLSQAPVVLANILAPVLINMFETGLADCVLPSGLIVLGGILHSQADAVQKSAEAQHLKLVELLRNGDWVVLVMHRVV